MMDDDTSYSITALYCCFFVCAGVFQWKGFVHWTVCVPVPFEIQQLRTKPIIPNCLCCIFIISLCHMYIINLLLPTHSMLCWIFVVILFLTLDVSMWQSMVCAYADSTLHLLYGQRRLTKHASPDAPQRECLTSMVTNPNWWRSSALFSNPFTAETC